MSTPYQISSVSHLGEYRLRVGFVDGTFRTIDLGPKLASSVGPIFEPLRDVAFFAQVSVDPEIGTVVWPTEQISLPTPYMKVHLTKPPRTNSRWLQQGRPSG